MSQTEDPVDAHLASLARGTLAAAPVPAPHAVVRILAERRGAQLGSRRLLALVTVTNAVPALLVLLAWVVRPAAAGGSLLAATLLGLALAPAIGGITRVAGNP